MGGEFRGSRGAGTDLGNCLRAETEPLETLGEKPPQIHMIAVPPPALLHREGAESLDDLGSNRIVWCRNSGPKTGCEAVCRDPELDLEAADHRTHDVARGSPPAGVNGSDDSSASDQNRDAVGRPHQKPYPSLWGDQGVAAADAGGGAQSLAGFRAEGGDQVSVDLVAPANGA